MRTLGHRTQTFPSNLPRKFFSAILGVAVVVTGCVNLGPRIKEGQPVKGAVGHVVNLNQGWRQEEQQLFYFTTQGSQLMPYDWFLALEQPGSTNLFRADENMERLRWLLARPTHRNPDGLPVGFVKDVDVETGRNYVGLTCAACHTTEIKFHDVSLRIDGGPTMADTQSFIQELAEAMVETLGSPKKFDRLAHAVLRSDYNEKSERKLRVEFRSVREYLVHRNQRNASPSPYGHARLDAFGNILNEVLAYGLDIRTNARPSDAPVSFPFLWDTAQADRGQWNGVAQNNPAGAPPGLGSLGRNVGEVLGVFGKFQIQPTVPPFGYQSTAKLNNLGCLEKWSSDLWSPKWPEEFLPPLNPDAVKRGGQIYHREHSCVGCHQVIVRDDPDRKFNVHMIPLRVVGTDPTMASNFVARIADTGRLAGTLKNVLSGTAVFSNSAAGGEILDSIGFGVILRHPINALIGGFEGDVHTFHAPPATLLAYKARPLNGIWATAPYLHNGSVPNLWELLKKPADRVKTFYVGSREFDPVDVGFDTNKIPEVNAPLDTTLAGNSNAGHTWGTELSEPEKRDLIEYLKSL